jgi:hypothetical protein
VSAPVADVLAAVAADEKSFGAPVAA